ncbi:2-oxoacid:acceptor oxidoreductase family protein [Actinomadura sp. ATCC 31491]|uniref:2-oxoacid:acceptor oxidoreductase family protein n=1 Tax=Actinomadura luzonensis TaxID=2805427 RepID=A0ABT0FU78_9ACTN|nr:2-oxoacid:acceptor oxidoreductase family protein [Actinomadura luzonensis]MCK2215888.1 2-oxoacid:acceptor oxidoreductase family protein [Actinomadura luzonensis]
MVFQTRIHGRGGQGVVTAAEMLSVAAFLEGRHAQAFPTFGSERTGAPVVSYCRISDQEIRVREPIVEPDCVIVQDVTLLRQIDVFAGLRPGGHVLINTAKGPEELGVRGVCVPATEIALRHVGKPVPNAALLGAFCALTGVLSLESVCAAVRATFPGPVAEANVAAAGEAHAHLKAQLEEAARA